AAFLFLLVRLILVLFFLFQVVKTSFLSILFSLAKIKWLASFLTAALHFLTSLTAASHVTRLADVLPVAGLPLYRVLSCHCNCTHPQGIATFAGSQHSA